MLKLCKVCGEYKEESEFPVHSHGRLKNGEELIGQKGEKLFKT